MKNIEKLKQVLLKGNLNENEFIKNIGEFIDLASELKLTQETNFAITILEQEKDSINLQHNQCLYHYYLSVAYGDKYKLEVAKTSQDWEWELEVIDNEFKNLQLAYELINEGTPNGARACILTNLANRFNNRGRFINAFDIWNEVITTEIFSGMSFISKGDALMYYLNYINDRNYQYAFIQLGYKYLKYGLNKGVYPYVKHNIKQKISIIETDYHLFLNYKFNKTDFENNEFDNKKYINWGIENKLFLNPLSNVSKHLNSSKDDIKVNPQIDDELTVMFNDIVEKYKYSRFQFYKSLKSNSKPYAKQQKQSAFSIAYSLFDKIAYFINKAFNIEIRYNRVSFKGIWYNKLRVEKGLNQKFIESPNLMLMGIFWVGKELYDNEKKFENLIEPKAKGIDAMRNHIEHKNLQFGENNGDSFTFSIPENEFNDNYLRLLKLVRESIIYLAYSIRKDTN